MKKTNNMKNSLVGHQGLYELYQARCFENSWPGYVSKYLLKVLIFLAEVSLCMWFVSVW